MANTGYAKDFWEGYLVFLAGNFVVFRFIIGRDGALAFCFLFSVLTAVVLIQTLIDGRDRQPAFSEIMRCLTVSYPIGMAIGYLALSVLT